MLSVEQIEGMGNEIVSELMERKIGDAIVYFNNKRVLVTDEGKKIIEENINAHDYLEYAGDILSMAFEGYLYHCFNYEDFEGPDWLKNIFTRYGVYAELGHAWNLSVYEENW